MRSRGKEMLYHNQSPGVSEYNLHPPQTSRTGLLYLVPPGSWDGTSKKVEKADPWSSRRPVRSHVSAVAQDSSRAMALGFQGRVLVWLVLKLLCGDVEYAARESCFGILARRYCGKKQCHGGVPSTVTRRRSDLLHVRACECS